jgi:hypothetical protein
MGSFLTVEEEIDILLEVSARLDNPNTWTMGTFHSGMRHCTVGHILNVLDEYNYGYADRLVFIVRSLDRTSFPLFGLGLTGVNDKKGRKAAKLVVETRIRDLKDRFGTP